uniref:Uncharacterized protein n=1 Tax=Chenopodium quinoa TaxID=63459 RepID=A0A803MB81_CHEQI
MVLSMFDQHPVLEFRVDSLNVTSMKVYKSIRDYYSIVQDKKRVTADFDVTLTLTNKGEEVLDFDPLQVSLEYHQDEILSPTSIVPFLLHEGQQQPVQFGMQIKDDARLRNETVDSMSQDLWDEHVVQFDLKGQGHYVRLRDDDFTKCKIKILCNDIKVGFSLANNLRSGSMIGNPILCKWESICL